MPIKYLTDKVGEVLRVLNIDGYNIPANDVLVPNHEEEFRSIPKWKTRDDDMLICAYPKAGSHWLLEVTSMLLNGSTDRVNLEKGMTMLDILSQQMFDDVKSPRVLNSHILFRYLPEDFVKRKCKIVYILRNPKDVAVSFYNHHYKLLEYEYNGKWDNYIHRFIEGQVDYGSWFDYTLDWEKVIQENPDLPIHVMTYEDMKEDCFREITRLAQFLDVKADQELIQGIADECDFSKMKKRKDQLSAGEEGWWRDKQSGWYRKGQLGDWKNWFTVAQSERFDAVYAKRMKNSKVQLRFT